MLVELGVVEQRYQAVLEVLSGVTVTDVARRYGVARQAVHTWLGRYARSGLAGLVDRSSKPLSCPHQMPGWGGGSGGGAAVCSSGVGSANDRVSPGARRGVAGAVEVVDFIELCCAITWWIGRSAGNAGRITSGGNVSRRWSCGRWT